MMDVEPQPGTSAEEDNLENYEYKRRSRLKVGDEVCRLVQDELVFGTIQYKKDKPSASEAKSSNKDNETWIVKWIHDPSMSVDEETRDYDLIPTDRAIYKGSRVRLGEKRGTCRSVLHKADVRILGTNSVLQAVNIEEFSHLKEFTQKSVVHYNGWLGIVLLCERKVSIRLSDDSLALYDLNTVLPTGQFRLESHWINEVVTNFSCNGGIIIKRKPQEVSDSVSAISPPQEIDTDGEPFAKKAKGIGFIRDLQVECVKIQWLHQIDPSFPDKPRQEFKEGHSLQLVKENVSVDDASFSFEVGNLGRIRTKNFAEEYLRWDDWQKKFAAQNISTKMVTQLRSGLEYDKSVRSKYWRAYNRNAGDELIGLGDEDDNKENVQGCTDNKIKEGGSGDDVEQFVVVEIAHICTIPDIVWEDNTSGLPSSLDLEIIEDTIFNDAEPCPGDFITSRHLPYSIDKTYCVVLRQELTSAGVKSLVVRVLDTEIPGKVVADQASIIAADLRLSAKFVERHPVYQFFNESNTIVVVNEERPGGATKIRIGNVVRTNLLGKVNVRFLEGGSNYKEEWIWPQICAIYSAKGFDLECVKSHVVDSDSNIEFEMKVRNVLEMLDNKVDLVWKNSSKSEKDFAISLKEFDFIFNQYKSICVRASQPFTHAAYNALTAHLSLGLDGRASYLKGNDVLIQLVSSAVKEIVTNAHAVLGIHNDAQCSEVEMIDLTKTEGNICVTDPLEKIFAETIALLEHHPVSHYYAASTEFKPNHGASFKKSVMEEFDRLKKICSTETKAEMGILSRCFEDRIDLLSFVIRGPEETPYEDGLYLFDAYLPSNYPNVPPRFHFHAFRAGRLNPNLYAEGKVCVSLLGTWEGRDEREKWTKDSNIVQILISIQGLILVKEPFHNEPGYEANNFNADNTNTHRRNYNTTLMPLIVKMMINQITFGMEPFTEQINAFYRLQVPIFLARWRSWLKVTKKSDLDSGIKPPAFVLYPIDSNFKRIMTQELDNLEKLWKDKLSESNT